jgi:hypothetical protein
MVKRLAFMISVALILSLPVQADVVIGDFEGGMGDWGPTSENNVILTASDIGVTSGKESLSVWLLTGGYWALQYKAPALPRDLSAAKIQFDVTVVQSEWVSNNWTKVADKIALNSDGAGGWKEFYPTVVDKTTGAASAGDWGPWSPGLTRTFTADISSYDLTGATWFQINIALQQNPATGAGCFYFDNVKLLGVTLPGPAKITYVDAKVGDANNPGNTTLADGSPLVTTGDASGADEMWRARAFGTGASILESGGSYGDTANPEDCERLLTAITVPENSYLVYVYFWSDGGPWRIGASFKDDPNGLPLFIANDPNSPTTIANAPDFEGAVPMLTEGNRTLWQALVGTTDKTTTIKVYIDDDARHMSHTKRTWYDGIGYKVAPPKITYVDASTGDAGNTTFAGGTPFVTVADASGTDSMWRARAFGNSGTIFESGGNYGETANPENCPRLQTTISVPRNLYQVYAYFWADTSGWRLRASLKDDPNELPLFVANSTDPNAPVAQAKAVDFEPPVPLLTEGNRTLWQVLVGTTGLVDTIKVYVDDDPAHMTHNSRTWYDGIGYKAVE